MPFDPKDGGSTYERAMTTLLHNMMHKEMEVYMDDTIAKSITEEDHLLDLKKVFEQLKIYDLRLKPQ